MAKDDEALKLLKDIRHIVRLIEEYQEEISEIQTQLTNTTVKPKVVDVQSSGAADPMADKVIRKMELIEKLEQQQSILVDKKLLALSIIEQMEIDERRVINMKYFKRYSTEEIGERIGYSYRWAWEKVHQAEEHFIEIFEKTT